MNVACDASDEDERVRQEAFRRRQRPDNEVPVSVAVDAVLLEGIDSAVLLGNVQVFSNGFAFSITAMTRHHPAPPGVAGVNSLHPYGETADSFLLGVEYADGRSTSTLPNHHGPWGDPASDALSLMAGGGSGGSRYADAAYYLSPLPPAGVVRFIAVWPSLGLPETITEIPADQILTAASRVRRLWAWEPEPPYTPPAPEVPAGGWFEAYINGIRGSAATDPDPDAEPH
jgi:hypothetical protein